MKVFICLAVVVACALAQQGPCYDDAGEYNGKTVKEVKEHCKSKTGKEFYECAIGAFGVKPENLEAFNKAVALKGRYDELVNLGKECSKSGEWDADCVDKELVKICSEAPQNA